MNFAFRTTDQASPVWDRQAASRPAFRVEIFRDLTQAEPLWRQLAAGDAAAPPYQAFDWVKLWHRHVSGPEGLTPFIVVGVDDTGAPLFLWPLVQKKIGPVQTLCFFGGKHATINMTLWRRDVADAFTRGDLEKVLADIARQAPDVDLLLLHNQPARWTDVPNPFALLAHQQSNEDNFVLRLGLPGQQIIEREISNTMRSRLRNKERKLAKLKDYRYIRADNAKDIDHLLKQFFDQKAEKLEALRIDNVFAEPGVEAFIRAGCHLGLERDQPVIELHALEGDGEMLALFSAIHDGKRITSMFNSHTASDHSRHSPGLILLQYVVAHCADRNFQVFDIGPGEARYKTFFCKELEGIFDSILPLSPRGRMAYLPLRWLLASRSAIKRNPTLWRVAHSVRAFISRLKQK